MTRGATGPVGVSGDAPGRVAAVFLSQGMLIGSLGVAVGVISGVLIARNVGSILEL